MMVPLRDFTWLTVGTVPRSDDADSKPSPEAVGLADTVLDGFRLGDLVVRAASVRGSSHRFYGQPRQDSYAFSQSSEGAHLVAAVADGVSAVPNAHAAAAYAVRSAVIAVRRRLDSTPDAAPSVDAAPIEWRSLFTEVASSLSAHVPGLAPRGEARSLLDGQVSGQGVGALPSATTLTVAVVVAGEARTRVWCAGVGDSSLWSLRSGTWRCHLGAKTAQDLRDGSVRALPALSADEPHSASLDLETSDVLLLATDGVTDAFGAGDSVLAATFARELVAPPPPLGFGAAIGFRSRGADDDRTAIALWRAGMEDAVERSSTSEEGR